MQRTTIEHNKKNKQRARDLSVMGAYLRQRRLAVEAALDDGPKETDRAMRVEELGQIERLGRLYTELLGEAGAALNTDHT